MRPKAHKRQNHQNYKKKRAQPHALAVRGRIGWFVVSGPRDGAAGRSWLYRTLAPIISQRRLPDAQKEKQLNAMFVADVAMLFRDAILLIYLKENIQVFRCEFLTKVQKKRQNKLR